ncbi:MAG: SIR2 family protein [Phycisphaerae bacterium]|nr:SIR2 family protein [Phycisphaerae bacterium]
MFCSAKDELNSLLAYGVTIEDICAEAIEFATLGKAIRRCLCETFKRTYGMRQPPNGEEWRKGDLPEPRPQLAFELLAHLMKHSFIDHAITFNFDDVFENALDSELGTTNYDLVFSDHQPMPSTPHAGDRPEPRRPRLVKLHGTVRAPMTLRFTPTATRRMPPILSSLLDNTVFGLDPGDGAALTGSDINTKAHIISLGYSWRDRGILNWLSQRTRHIASLTLLVRIEDDDTEQHRAINRLRELSHKGGWSLHVLCTRAACPRGQILIDHVLWVLWNRLNEMLLETSRENGPLIPAARHFVLDALFRAGAEVGANRHLPHSASLRLKIELALHLLKCKGMAHANVLGRTARVHRYRHQLSPQNWELTNRDLHKHLYRDASDPDAFEAVFSLTGTALEFSTSLQRLIGLTPGHTVEVPDISADEKSIALSRMKLSELLNQWMNDIYAAEEVEIVPGMDPLTEWLFRRIDTIDSWRLMRSRTLDLLDTDWTHLFVIAETGQWLKLLESEKSKVRARKALLIGASERGLDDWVMYKQAVSTTLAKTRAAMGKANVEVLLSEIPWWQHNRHMTLAWNDKNRAFVGAIYFRRRLKIAQVSPAYLTDQHDLLECFRIFLSYTIRASREALGVKRDANSRPVAAPLLRDGALISQVFPTFRREVERVASHVVSSGACLDHAEARDRINILLTRLKKIPVPNAGRRSRARPGAP